jgi:L-rhamnose 1-dehydrogenase
MGRKGASAVVDVRDEGGIDAFVAGAVEAFGGVDIFVNNAAVTFMEHLLNTPAEQVDRVIDTNLKGSIRFLQRVGRRMVEQGRGGSIVIVTSVNAVWPLPSQAVYTSTKAALEALMTCLASDLAKHGIRVNSVAPGAIYTDMNAHFTPEVEARLKKRIPLGRIGEPEDIGDIVAFLASHAARYITGATVVADGGFRLRP